MNTNLNKLVYQVYVKSFFDSNGDGYGDINGVTAKLDYIKSLGTDIIWLSPIYPSGGVDGGYDISDYLGIDPKYGTSADFDTLIKEANKREISIMMDMVVNHSSDKHPWFQESKKHTDNPYRDYYIWRTGKGENTPPNNWSSIFGTGSAWKYDKQTKQWYLHLFAEGQPDLNWENPKVREEVYTLMNKWLERGVKGFRMDVITYISKPIGLPDTRGESVSMLVSGGPHFMSYIGEMRENVLSKGAELVIGEAAGMGIDAALKYAPLSGDALDAVFQFETNDLDGGESGKWNNLRIAPKDFARLLFEWQEKTDSKANLMLYISNHDQPRAVERYVPDVVKYRDTGNGYYDKAAKMLALFVYFMRGTPVIYNGDELGLRNAVFDSADDLVDIEACTAYKNMIAEGLRNHEAMEIINRKARDVVRAPLQWDELEFYGFSDCAPWIKGKPAEHDRNVSTQEKDPCSVLNFYRKLFSLRKKLLAILYGSFEHFDTGCEDVFAYERKFNGECVFVLCNFSDKEQVINHRGIPRTLGPFDYLLISSDQEILL